MDQEKTLCIEKFKKDIEDTVRPEYLYPYLIENGAICDTDCELIDSLPDRRSRCHAMISVLQQKPRDSDVMARFIAALHDSNEAPIVVKQMRSYLADRTDSEPCNFMKNNMEDTNTNACVSIDECDDISESDSEEVPIEMGSSPCRVPAANQLVSLRDTNPAVRRFLSSLINKGDFDSFNYLKSRLEISHPHDWNLRQHIMYLEACALNYSHKFGKCMKVLNKAIKHIDKTNNPTKFTLDILNLKCWLYSKNKRFGSLEQCLSEAKQIVSCDPVSYGGRLGGWIMWNSGRFLTFLSQNNSSHAAALQKQAISDFQRSLDLFYADTGQIPSGAYFCLMDMAFLLLNCGPKMYNANNISCNPTQRDIDLASSYLQKVEEAFLGREMPKVIRSCYNVFRSDLEFRLGNIKGGYKAAKMAFEATKKMHLSEEMQFAHDRLEFYNTTYGLNDANEEQITAHIPRTIKKVFQRSHQKATQVRIQNTRKTTVNRSKQCCNLKKNVSVILKQVHAKGNEWGVEQLCKEISFKDLKNSVTVLEERNKEMINKRHKCQQAKRLIALFMADNGTYPFDDDDVDKRLPQNDRQDLEGRLSRMENAVDRCVSAIDTLANTFQHLNEVCNEDN